MHTTTTIRTIPTKFIGFELDEGEAHALLQHLTAVCGQAGNCQPVQELRPFLEQLEQALQDAPPNAAKEQPPASAQAEPFGTRKHKSWECPVCHERRDFYSRRDHYKRKHPDVPLPERLIAYPEPKTKATDPELPVPTHEIHAVDDELPAEEIVYQQTPEQWRAAVDAAHAYPAAIVANAQLVNAEPAPPILVDFPTSRPVPLASRIVCYTCDKVFDNETQRRAHDCQRETLERDLNRAPSDGAARKRLIAVGV